MDITVYLPDHIGREAKAAGLNLSALLRAAVTRELERRSEHAAETGVHTLDINDASGDHTLRLHGRVIAEDGDVVVYLTDFDQRLFAHDRNSHQLKEIYEDDLRDWIGSDDEYIHAMSALGKNAVIDIGQAR